MKGDTNTRFFHLQACHRNRKRYIPTIEHEGRTLAAEDAKADTIYDSYNNLLGKYFARARNINRHK
jgi:cyclopropane fatty-acyl-phospholipid synthase-like methyltransferase